MDIILNHPGVTVQRLRNEHIDGILNLMNQEGWFYYDRHELQRYITLHQNCFTLLKDGRVAGSIFTTNYGNQVWIGNIVIEKDSRGLGLAAQLINGVIGTLREHEQVHTFRLGSVPLAIDLYKKLGFHAEAFTTAQEAKLPLDTAVENIHLGEKVRVERFDEQDLEAISRLDERYFKSNRLPLLRELYKDSIKACCVCLKDQGTIVGFLMARRRQASKAEGHFAEGSDVAYRLGPSCILPDVGIDGFKALFQKVIQVINANVLEQGGRAKIYTVFPRNADQEEIYQDTRELATEMGLDPEMDLERIFDEHDDLFGGPKSSKNEEQWNYMKQLGFHQEYFEQVMRYRPAEALNTPSGQREDGETKADPEGIFASATPGDKA